MKVRQYKDVHNHHLKNIEEKTNELQVMKKTLGNNVMDKTKI